MSDFALATVGRIVADEDFQDRVKAATVRLGVSDPAFFMSAYLWHVAAYDKVAVPYQYAVSSEPYPGAHGRIGFDPAVVPDADIMAAVASAITRFEVPCHSADEVGA
ncbi:hypothetical protein CYK24_03165 [Trueperella bernardiae]|uniref:hypothetical protein n=1 Tax=Trueperella bernardiae TaxID=59561 RepID=UPI000C7A4185|nr:hypothetical protein [Trueperella bernardiae]PKZ89308.1 hypothetical protein CYK24_03165 [Trueperella bernardiae]